jgi:hypothetical protein
MRLFLLCTLISAVFSFKSEIELTKQLIQLYEHKIELLKAHSNSTLLTERQVDYFVHIQQSQSVVLPSKVELWNFKTQFPV